MEVGAKTTLESSRKNLIAKLKENFDYIEVVYKPIPIEKINEDFISGTRFILHAPHDFEQANLTSQKFNIDLLKTAIEFARGIGSEFIIIHPGYFPIENKAREQEYTKIAIKNLESLNRFSSDLGIKLLLENLPLISICGYLELCSKAEDMKQIIDTFGIGFVLDFSHAYYASVTYGMDYKAFIHKFMKLGPDMFHLCDGIPKEIDSHLPLGKGKLDLPFFISQIRDKDVTLEITPSTAKNYMSSLNYLKSHLK